MLKKENLTKITVILFIFLLGFILRAESANLYGIPDKEKQFYKDENGIPYAYDMDSYYNYRLTKNYLDHGYLGDAIKDGREWDFHSYYPPGVPMDYPPLIVYVTAFFYKVINLFLKLPLFTVCFWLPAFLAPLCGIPAYLFVRRLANDYGGIVAGILTVMSLIYVIRTVPGFFDTDMFNVLFPFLVVWFFVEAFYADDTKKSMYYAFLSGFSMFIFSLAWNGWQYLLYVISFVSIFYIIWCKLKERNVRNSLYVFGIFLFTNIILICVFTGFLNIVKVFLGLFEFVKLAGGQNLWAPWPNTYISIVELQYPSLVDVINGLGPSLLVLGIFGLFVMFFIIKKKDKSKKPLNIDWFFYLLIFAWILVGFGALTKGVRFLLILIPPLAISAGVTVGIFVDYLNSLKKANIKKIISILIIFLITVPSMLIAFGTLYNLTPHMNDDMWNTGQWINNHTADNTVVVSSWVYGHFFTAIVDRPVIYDGRLAYIETLPIRQFLDGSMTFEGKSPNTSREYWMNRALATSNESLSLGIFRMLTSSGDGAYLTLDKYTKNTSKSVEILNNILGVEKNIAKDMLINNYHLNQKQSDEILKYTHPANPNPFVLVTYDEMIYKGYWVFYYGDWNFNELRGGTYTYSFGN
ncbi:MAG: peptide transporter, partial [Euryarchaeota archaeon]|nr:peptide transporter [Euryarchaeota archaeon]